MSEQINKSNIYTQRAKNLSKNQLENQSALEIYLQKSNSTNQLQNNQGILARNTVRTFNSLASTTTNLSNSKDTNKSSLSSRNSSRLLKFFDIDKNGEVSDDEAISFILKSRSQGNKTTPSIYPFNKNAKDFDQVVDNFDKLDLKGTFTDQEVTLALLALKNNEFSKISYENAVKILKTNINFDEINRIHHLINKQNDSIISELEIVDAVKLSKTGLLDINNPHAQRILRTNHNFDKILNILDKANGDLNSILSNQDVYDVLMALRRGDLTDLQSTQLLFLSANPNRDVIANSIEKFDVDRNGISSNEEFKKFIINLRNGELKPEEHDCLVNILSSNETFQNLKNIINTLDSKADGIFNDDEIINFSLAVRKGQINLNKDLTDFVTKDINNFKSINELVNFVDKNSSGEIENTEILEAIRAFSLGEIKESNLELLNKILSTNLNFQNIKLALEHIDNDKNGKVDAKEFVKAELYFRQGKIKNIDRTTWDSVMSLNKDSEELFKVINTFDDGKNGIITKNNFINKILDYRKASIKNLNPDIFNQATLILDEEINLLNSLNIFDPDKTGVITDKSFAKGILMSRAGKISSDTEFLDIMASNNANSQIISEAISILDADKTGIVSAEEFNNNFTKSISVNGQIDFNRMSIISNILDVIYPDAQKLDKFRDDLDIDDDRRLSDTELLDGLLALFAGNIENPGLDIVKVVISGNPNHENILAVIKKIDSELDGAISNKEATLALLAVRRGEFSNEQLPFAQAVLMKNPNLDEIQKQINIYDPDLNGKISNLEYFDASFKIRRGEIDFPINLEVFEILKAQNLNIPAIDNLINIFDPDKSGKINYNELLKGLLAINLGSLNRPENELLLNLPNNEALDYGETVLQAETIIRQFEQNKNGQFGDNEIATLYLANKSNNVLNGFSTEFAEAIFASNPRSPEIISLINSVDKDNDGFFSEDEIIKSRLAFLKGTFTTISEDLFDMVLSSNSEYSKFKNIILRVDSDRNGEISDKNTVEALFTFNDTHLSSKYKAEGTNKLDSRTREILNLVLNQNSSNTSLENSYTQLAISSGGDLMRMKNTLLELKFGENNLNQFDNLINPASEIINQWDSQVKSAYSEQLTELLSLINSQTQNKDLDSLGMNTLVGFTNTLNQIKTDLVNGKKSSFNDLHDLFDNYQRSTNSLPQKTPSLVSSIFYEDFKANLNTVKTFLDTGVMNNFDSKFQELAQLSILFDKDKDGKFKAQEIMHGLLDLSFNKVSVSDPRLLDLLFGSSEDYPIIKNFLSEFDLDGNKQISKLEFLNLYTTVTKSTNTANKNLLAIISEYDDFSSSFNTIKAFDIYRQADYSDSAILQGFLFMRANSNLSFDQDTLTEILKLNSDSSGILKLVNIIDPDGDGKYHNVNDVLQHAITIWRRQIPSNDLRYDFNGDGVVNDADASTLYNLHMNHSSLSKFEIAR